MELIKRFKFPIILFLLGMLQYSNTFNHEYAWDDAIVITQNSRTQKGFAGIPEVIQNYRSLKLQDQYGYRPVTLITYCIEIGIWGKSPGVQHFNNTLLYALLCVLIFLVLKKLFQDKSELLLFLACVLFVVHPLHVEAVANIKSRDELLAMIFGFLALSFFINYYRNTNWIQLALSVIMVILGYWSKESAITIIGVMAISLWVDSSFGWKKKLLHLVPLILLPFLIYGIRGKNYDTHSMYHVSETEMRESGAFNEDPAIGNPLHLVDSKLNLLANSTYILGKYLYNFILPVNLVHDYAYNQVPLRKWDIYSILSGLLHLFALGLGVFFIFKRNFWAWNILYYLGSISIYSHIILLAPDFMADRFMLAPSLGLCLLLVFGIDFVLKVDWKEKFSFSSKKLIIFGILILSYSLFLSYHTFQRNKIWKNNITLFEGDMDKMPNCSRMHFNYALTLYTYLPHVDGKTKVKYEDLIPKHYQRAYAITPMAFRSYLNYTNFLIERNRNQEAEKVMNECIKHHKDKGSAHFHLGKVKMILQKYEEAIPPLKIAIEEMPKLTESYVMLAFSQFRTADPGSALNTLYDGLKQEPDYPEYYEFMADIFFATHQPTKAIEYIDKALKYSPTSENYLSKRESFVRGQIPQ